VVDDVVAVDGRVERVELVVVAVVFEVVFVAVVESSVYLMCFDELLVVVVFVEAVLSLLRMKVPLLGDCTY